MLLCPRRLGYTETEEKGRLENQTNNKLTSLSQRATEKCRQVIDIRTERGRERERKGTRKIKKQRERGGGGSNWS